MMCALCWVERGTLQQDFASLTLEASSPGRWCTKPRAGAAVFLGSVPCEDRRPPIRICSAPRRRRSTASDHDLQLGKELRYASRLRGTGLPVVALCMLVRGQRSADALRSCEGSGSKHQAPRGSWTGTRGEEASWPTCPGTPTPRVLIAR
ncbi:hypothetical protein C8Q80DRAFT_846421 [Daedaleopsis nitida]|nr:hypothetical protein C8Q80DRAFT_846421 [Daedaleopsis nitida]